ncbi:MAG: TatD family hydrolase [Bacteroidota bacterium]|nr:TatD family hydrolase [Bacteroidota bacterium]
MSLVDTHIHLYANDYDTDRDDLIVAARKSGVQRFCLPNIDTESLGGMLALSAKWKNVCFPMFGLHPCSVKEDYKKQLDVIYRSLQLNREQAVGIGETGLDFYWDLTHKKEQMDALLVQAQWAREMKLPLVIHSRNSTQEIIDLLKLLNAPDLTGVFHCFSGTADQAEQIIALGFYLGIGGVVTFKNSGLDTILPGLPLDRILLETDGPYLAPVPFRGKRNEPAYLKIITEKIAAIKSVSAEVIAEATTANAEMLFQLSSLNTTL